MLVLITNNISFTKKTFNDKSFITDNIEVLHKCMIQSIFTYFCNFTP